MKSSITLNASILLALVFACNPVRADLPPDFPGMTVTVCDTNSVGSGYIFLEVTDSSTNGGYYVMILNNDGTPVWYQSLTNHVYDFKVLPNGYLHYGEFFHTYSWTGGGDVYHQILDNNFAPEEIVSAGNGYLADGHDFQLLPNGHAVLLSYYKSQMNLNQFISGAYPNALVAGAVIQELDGQRNVVWQWRSWDHYNFQTYYAPVLSTLLVAKNPVVDSFHLNTVVLDNDGNFLISNFMMDVEKINRQTGDVMWRLGGLGNQFRFVGENLQQAVTHFSGHGLSRLPNGNILIYCNADQQATHTSKVYEYQLDEINKVATLVWSYTPTNNYYAWHYGSAQRLANGNTFIGWGGGTIMPGIGGTTNAVVPACTEVTSSGRVVFNLNFSDPLMTSYRAFRFVYPPQTQADQVLLSGLATGNNYDFGDTGVSLQVNQGGGNYNSVAVKRESYAPVNPLFNGKAPAVLPFRVQLTASAVTTMAATVSFDPASFNFTNPAALTVYYRATPGQGVFLAQPSSFNPVIGLLSATVTMNAQAGQLGEFIFGSPDVAEIPYPPILNAVQNYPGVQPLEVVAPLKATLNETDSVNQLLPIWLSWSPKGFASFYALQIATTPDFAAPVVDIPYQTDAFYVWSNALPGTTYYFRVNTANDGGTGAWATNAFQTVPPFLQMLVPNGGEAWRRGLTYFVQWNDNLAENVTVDLYKGGAYVGNLATNIPSTGACKWSIPAAFTTGNNYSFKITSMTQPSLFTTSAANFSVVDPPSFNPGSAVRHPDGSVDFSVTAPGAATVSVLISSNLLSWQWLLSAPVTNGSSAFTGLPMSPRFYRLSVP